MTELPDFAISVRQPWAWALIHGGKDVENRTKQAITIGRMDQHKHLAIHASTGMTRSEYETARNFMASIGVKCPRPDALVRGALIGSVGVTGVVKESDSDWFFGPWALEVTDPMPCQPIPVIGQLGAFRWKRAGDDVLRVPLPWMVAWPNRAITRLPAAEQPEPTPTLFGEAS